MLENHGILYFYDIITDIFTDIHRKFRWLYRFSKYFLFEYFIDVRFESKEKNGQRISLKIESFYIWPMDPAFKSFRNESRIIRPAQTLAYPNRFATFSRFIKFYERAIEINGK